MTVESWFYMSFKISTLHFMACNVTFFIQNMRQCTLYWLIYSYATSENYFYWLKSLWRSYSIKWMNAQQKNKCMQSRQTKTNVVNLQETGEVHAVTSKWLEAAPQRKWFNRTVRTSRRGWASSSKLVYTFRAPQFLLTWRIQLSA